MAVVEVKYEEAITENKVKAGENGVWEDDDEEVADRPIVSKKVVHNLDAEFYKKHRSIDVLEDDVIEAKVTQKKEEGSSLERIARLEASLDKALAVIESMNAPKQKEAVKRGPKPAKKEEAIEQVSFL